MSTASTPQLMTAEEFFDFANDEERVDRQLELDKGEVVEIFRSGVRRSFVCGNLVGLLGIFVREVRCGRVYCNNMGIILGRNPDTVLGADVVLYTDSKRYEDLNPRYPDTLPQLVIEALSPKESHIRMILRLNRFLHSGVKVVWMVDPDSRMVTFWWQGQAPIVVEDGEEIANLPGLPEFRCKVSEIFESPGG